jgi:hypothetical protein
VLGAIIVAFLPSNKQERERERERESKKKYFYCNLCYIEYPEDSLGGKTELEGTICKYCMEKKHKEKK